MADKILRTKIALLHKTFEEWEEIKDSYVPLKGEVCFCDFPASSEVEESVLFKVGNGEDTFADLPFASALAADVYGWAKKEFLEFDDLSDAFKTDIKEYIETQTGGTMYRIVDKGNNVWQLEKSADGKTWVEASGTIDLSNTLEDIDERLEEKVDKEVTSSEATTTIINDGDKAGVSYDDGTSEAFVGVEGGKAHYLKDGELASEDTELVTKADIKDLEGALHFIGVTNREKDSEGQYTETVEEAIERLLEEKGVEEPKSGDVVIVDTAEYVFDGEEWKEIGDEGTYATKADLEFEVERAQFAEIELDNRVDILEEAIDSLDPIAYDGLVNNLKQKTGEYLILDCNAE